MSLHIRPYKPSDEASLLALEYQSPQGVAIVLRMLRPRFSIRAETFPKHQILVAEMDGIIVGVAAAALVPIMVGGVRHMANYFFDWRVAPEFKRQHIGSTLYRVLQEQWCAANGSSIIISTIKKANVATRLGLTKKGQAAWIRPFQYLTIPTDRTIPKFLDLPQVPSSVSTDLLGPTAFTSLYEAVQSTGYNTAPCIWRTDRVYSVQVERIATWYYPLLAVNGWVHGSFTQLPKKGATYSFAAVNLASCNPVQQLNNVLPYLRSQAVTYAVVVTGKNDDLYGILKSSSIASTAYWLVSNTDLGDGPIVLDMRCL